MGKKRRLNSAKSKFASKHSNHPRMTLLMKQETKTQHAEAEVHTEAEIHTEAETHTEVEPVQEISPIPPPSISKTIERPKAKKAAAPRKKTSTTKKKRTPKKKTTSASA